MASDIVNTYSDVLFEIYNRSNDLCNKGSQNGWPYCQTETGLRIFQEAAEPYVNGPAQPATSSSATSEPPRLQHRPIWLQSVWPVCVGALVVIGCLLALVWQAHRQALANARLQHQNAEMAKTSREAAQQLVQSLLAELRALNSNQAAWATSQAQIGAGLAKLGKADTQLAALASTQASATRELAAAQTALAEETTNLAASLRQIFQQGLGEASSQSHADILKLETQVAQAASNLAASLRQIFQRGLGEASGQSHADILKLQTQVGEVAASQQALLDRLAGVTNLPNLALALPGVRTRTSGNSILLTFDDSLFLHGTCFKPDAKSRLQAVARALAEVSTPLRIEVIGCADDDRVFKSWTAQFEESLALARATAVVDYFIELGLLAPKRLAALSGSATNRPFPSDTVQNRAKNRTAVLRVSTLEKPMEGYD